MAVTDRTGRHRRVRDSPLRAMAGRITWGLGDQAVSSVSNFFVGVYVARSLGAAAFGVFTLAWVTYGVVLGFSRGLATDPLSVRFSGVSTGLWRGAVARSSGTALLVGAATGVVSALAGLVIGGTVGAAFIALGVVLPGLMLQDSWRFAFFAAGQGRKAFVNDMVWNVALVPALLLAMPHGSVVAFLLAWGLSAAVAGAYGYWQTRMTPAWGGTGSWIREHRDLGSRFLAENVLVAGSGQLRMYGLGAIAGLADVGAVRGSQLLLGPFMAVLIGLSLVTVSEAARVVRERPHRLRLFALLLGGGQAAAAMVWGLALIVLLPESAGRCLLGDVWPSAAALILPATLAVAAASFTTGSSSALRALGAAGRGLRAEVVTFAGYVGGGLAGAAMGGAVGSSWGTAAGSALGAAARWLELEFCLRESAPTSEEMRTA
ncbi:hypothetical protein [Amycolatopsis granulosa]|uniref:hypothetical protein n=1 Tax=Amycolatopsis granulosa TaxID=185684 RepID=UPI0014249C6C|nr:hypothetical protein [Amycolatopsis granulosa]NIH85815.1 O-antigen/teichoic acid export membrane protein [Amycolatopsis granulosa]